MLDPPSLCTTFSIAFDGLTLFLFFRPITGRIQTNIIEMLTGEKKIKMLIYVGKKVQSTQT